MERYWEAIGGLNFIPGSIYSADRFARASFFLKSLPTKKDPDIISAVPGESLELQEISGVLGTLAVSTPLGISDPEKPNIASTLWRTLYDHKNSILYFDSATIPNTFWVRMEDLDFNELSPVKKLTISGGRIELI